MEFSAHVKFVGMLCQLLPGAKTGPAGTSPLISTALSARVRITQICCRHWASHVNHDTSSFIVGRSSMQNLINGGKRRPSASSRTRLESSGRRRYASCFIKRPACCRRLIISRSTQYRKARSGFNSKAWAATSVIILPTQSRAFPALYHPCQHRSTSYEDRSRVHKSLPE